MGPTSEEGTGIAGAHAVTVRDQVSGVVVATKLEEDTILVRPEAVLILHPEALPRAEEVATVQAVGS